MLSVVLQTVCQHWGFRKSGLIEIGYHLAILCQQLLTGRYHCTQWVGSSETSCLGICFPLLKKHGNLRGLTQITAIPGRPLNLSFLWLCHAARVAGSLDAKWKLLLHWNGNLPQRKFIFDSGGKAYCRMGFNMELTEPWVSNSLQSICCSTATRQARARKYVDKNMLSNLETNLPHLFSYSFIPFWWIH